MKSSKSSPKRTAKNLFDEISSFNLFFQLTSMAATSGAGISRAKVFELARTVPAPPAAAFRRINDLADKLRLNYPDACRVVADRIKSEAVRTFLLRLADALRSGEPLAGFLSREAGVQADNYTNEYERQIESAKKWTDAYVSIVVSVGLVVIINMVSTMIYNVGSAMMLGMIFASVVMSFILAWILSRAGPQEFFTVKWTEGSAEQRLGVRLLAICWASALLVAGVMALLHVKPGWVFVAVAALLVAPGVVAMNVENHVAKKDAEVSAFFRSVGGTATSRGTTLGQALMRIELKSFPALSADIRKLDLRLRSSARPEICWRLFAQGTGSKLITQATGIFFEATNLGGDPETAGVLCSQFAGRTAMLRAKRQGVAATFSWLVLVMHAVVAALMVFILGILKRFMALMQAAVPTGEGTAAIQRFMGQMLSFNMPQTGLLEQVIVALVVMLALINGFAIVASEGTHFFKTTYYFSLMMFLSGVAFLVVPPLVAKIM